MYSIRECASSNIGIQISNTDVTFGPGEASTAMQFRA